LFKQTVIAGGELAERCNLDYFGLIQSPKRGKLLNNNLRAMAPATKAKPKPRICAQNARKTAVFCGFGVLCPQILTPFPRACAALQQILTALHRICVAFCCTCVTICKYLQLYVVYV
jgi:hypothetical protein